MEPQEDEASTDMSAENLQSNTWKPSKVESSRDTPSVEKSGKILQLSAVNTCLPEDDETTQVYPNHTSSPCGTSCGRGAFQPPAVASAVVRPKASISLKTDKPARPDATKLIFYGQEMEHIQVFNQAVDDAIYRRYEEILPHLEPALLHYLRANRCKITGTAVQLKVLGATENAAKPWIVVHCHKKAMKKANKFLREEFVRRMCRGQIVFDTAVCYSLRPAYSEDPDEVFIEQDSQETHGAWAPQIKVTRSGIGRYATLGGFVSVTMTDGKTLVYGLTAGHVLPTEEYNNADGYVSSAEDSEDDEKDNDSVLSSTDGNPSDWSPNAGDISTLPGYPDSQDEVLAGLKHRSWASLGHIAKASRSKRAENHDWALIEFTATTKLTTTGPPNVSQAPFSVPLEVAHPTDDRRALIYNRSMVECTVSSVSARAILPSGDSFVDVDVLHPDSNEVLPKGSSGTWVSSADRTKVYGVIVATDCFGDLWMVRMTDITKDIQEEYNASEVAFARHVGTAGTEQGATTHMEVQQNSNSFGSTKSLVSSPRAIVFPVAEDLHEEEDDSLDEYPMEDHTIADKGQSSGSTAHDNPWEDTSTHFWPIERREPLATLNTPSATHHTHSTRSACSGCSTEDTEEHGSSKKKNLVWYCGLCHDGPYVIWQINCQVCGHTRCG